MKQVILTCCFCLKCKDLLQKWWEISSHLTALLVMSSGLGRSSMALQHTGQLLSGRQGDIDMCGFCNCFLAHAWLAYTITNDPDPPAGTCQDKIHILYQWNILYVMKWEGHHQHSRTVSLNTFLYYSVWMLFTTQHCPFHLSASSRWDLKLSLASIQCWCPPSQTQHSHHYLNSSSSSGLNTTCSSSSTAVKLLLWEISSQYVTVSPYCTFV